jgi:hypothetical protein
MFWILLKVNNARFSIAVLNDEFDSMESAAIYRSSRSSPSSNKNHIERSNFDARD